MMTRSPPEEARRCKPVGEARVGFTRTPTQAHVHTECKHKQERASDLTVTRPRSFAMQRDARFTNSRPRALVLASRTPISLHSAVSHIALVSSSCRFLSSSRAAVIPSTCATRHADTTTPVVLTGSGRGCCRATRGGCRRRRRHSDRTHT